MSSVKAWDRGISRVPWSVVKLLRVFRLGDLGALQPEWRGWSIGRAGLVSPEGLVYARGDFAWWSLTCRQAEAWRRERDRSRAGCPAVVGHGMARATGRSVSEPPSVFVRSAQSLGESRRLLLPWQAASLPNPLLTMQDPAAALDVVAASPRVDPPPAGSAATPAGGPRAGVPLLSGAAVYCVVRFQGATVALSLAAAVLSNCNQVDFALIAPPRLTGGESPQAAFARSSASRSAGGAS